MKPKQEPTSLTEALRLMLGESTDSLRTIARAAGVNHVSLMRFARGDQSLRLDLADRLAAHFGIQTYLPAKRERP